MVLSGLRDDEDGIARLIKSDKLICKLAEKLTNKLGHEKDEFNHIRGKLREVGRTVMAFKKVTGEENACLADKIDPSQFMKVAEATRLASGYSESTHLYETPSLALKIGHSLRKVAEILKSEALMNGDAALKQKSGDFISLYQMKWEELVSTHALRTLQEKRRNKPKYLPITADVSKLTKHLKEKVSGGKDKLTKEPDNQQAWRDLAEVTLASLIVFNRKRAGEVSKIKSADLQKLKKGSHGMNFGLSKLEQHLCKILWRIEIVGKRGRTVPVLTTDDMKDAVDLLNKTKENTGIWADNLYLFALANSEGHLRGVDVLRKHATLCGADNPEHLISTQLRKHIATVSQVMNLKENEMDILANFLGHDIRVHREYYRLPEETIQIAKVSKILLSIENGNLQNLTGRNLDDIELLDDEGNCSSKIVITVLTVLSWNYC
ncbi:uncharacterized protein LOC121423085 [Lytechinus variegatus]|uniref:uncharacterized protein LOC121423085 n=1 Tax=Lytechinus variegatus TaxID=7654 RepID=UPI001BB28080|nr:uncharacterized protein LOC121423085 [Lytechinus variegatus]